LLQIAVHIWLLTNNVRAAPLPMCSRPASKSLATPLQLALALCQPFRHHYSNVRSPAFRERRDQACIQAPRSLIDLDRLGALLVYGHESHKCEPRNQAPRDSA